MNLDLSAAFETAKPVCTVEIIGFLEPEDVAGSLKQPAPIDIANVSVAIDDPKDLKKIRAKHHSVARLIAGGMSQSMVASLCGYTESYLSILLDNPSMKELVGLYQIQYGSQHELLAEKLRTVAHAAVEEIEERLDDPAKRQEMDIHELATAAKLGLDRSGHGPQSKHHVVSEHHTFDHKELRRRDKAARGESADRIVPPSHQLPAPSEASDGTNAD